MEFFDILDINFNKTGKIKERDKIHEDGDLHGSVHIWVYSDKKLLFQKRKADKESYPNCYDIACTGHCAEGEDFIDAAIRETKEELNISATKDDFLFLFSQILSVDEIFHEKRFISNEVNFVYLLKNTVNFSSLDFQKEEISELKWLSISEFEKRINDDDFCILNAEWQKVKELIK